MKNLSTEHQAVALVTLNGVLDLMVRGLKAVEPVLGPLLTVGQIVIAVFTAIWIYNRVRGAKLDNKIKELEIAKLKREAKEK